MNDSLSQKNVLLVDDDDDLRGYVRDVLSNFGMSVTEAQSAEAAKIQILVQPFDAIISDVRMPLMSGLELLLFSKRVKRTPFILMTGYGELVGEDASKFGADAFLHKPFSKDDIVRSISQCLSATDKTTSPEEALFKLPTVHLAKMTNHTPELFLPLSASKFLKLIHAGQRLELERASTYVAKGIKHLFMSRADFFQCVGEQIRPGYIADNIDALGAAEGTKFLTTHMMKALADAGLSQGMSGADTRQARAALVAVVPQILNDQVLLETLVKIHEFSEQLYVHSLAVAFFSIVMAQATNWSNQQNLTKVILGALYHDAGMIALAPHLMLKAPASMTESERADYESHCAQSKELLKNSTALSPEILSIVESHHEHLDGTGFPMAVRKDKIPPVARLVAVADRLAYETLGRFTHNRVGIHNAIRKMVSEPREDLDPYFLAHFMKAVNFTLPAGYQRYIKKKD